MPLLTGATVIDLLTGQPAGTRADVREINDAGQVTGSRYLISVNDWRPYRWTPGAGFEALSGICCGTAWGADINNSGVVVGRTQAAINEGNRAFVAVATTMVNLGLLPGAGGESASSDAVAINDAGQIVGWSHTSTAARHAVLWSASYVIQDLGTLGGTNSEAVDINTAGQVVGMSDVAGGGRRAFIWSAGAGMQDLSVVIGYSLVPAAINAAGQIAGSYSAPGGQSHAFRYTPGSGLLDLGTLGGDSSVATGLNAQGDVVGTSKTGAGVRPRRRSRARHLRRGLTLLGRGLVRKRRDDEHADGGCAGRRGAALSARPGSVHAARRDERRLGGNVPADEPRARGRIHAPGAVQLQVAAWKPPAAVTSRRRRASSPSCLPPARGRRFVSGRCR